MRNLILVIIISFCFASMSWGQRDVAPIETHNGKKCYVHKVSKGQTAYGISKMYKTSVTELFKHNPDAENGLNIGQNLYFPLTEEELKLTNVKSEEVEKEIVKPDFSESTETKVSEKVDNNIIIHTVAAGETMYAISKKYSVKLDDLMAANKDKVTLNVGDKVVIPVDKANKVNEVEPLVKNPINSSVNPNDSVILHTVEAGQTFYFLQQQYGQTEAQIRASNDGLIKGLQKGEVIRIVVPKKNVTNVTNETFTPIVIDKSSIIKDEYNVAIMLPFMLDENDRFRAKCPPVGDCPFYKYTMISMSFQRGFMLAVDSLKKAGLNVKIHVYDTQNDTAVITKLLAKSEMKNIDLIFGPLFPKEIKTVSEFAKANQIVNVVPVPVSNKALFQNPYVSKFTASTPTQIEYMGRYIAENYSNANVIAIKNSAKKEDGFHFNEFVSSYNKNIMKQTNRMRDSVWTTSMNTSSKLTAVEAKLSTTQKNILVIPSEDVAHVSNIITKLTATINSVKFKDLDLMIFGLEDFMGFETIDEKYKNRYNLNVVAPNFVDFNDNDVKSFLIHHRLLYGIDPDKYTFNGFDAAFTNLKGLMMYGSKFQLNYNYLQTSGFSAGSNYKTVESGSGFENQSVYILKYNDYKIEVVNK
jgi:LysM repeat protein/ABC-type branched-subunit amino acid transport system substrate-binding protein